LPQRARFFNKKRKPVKKKEKIRKKTAASNNKDRSRAFQTARMAVPKLVCEVPYASCFAYFVRVDSGLSC
jgi:hypothetical protein